MGKFILKTKSKKIIFNFGFSLASMLFTPMMFLAAIIARAVQNKKRKPRLVWGSTPIINYSLWSNAMVKAGYRSETFTNKYFSNINKREDWDRILSEEYPLVWWPFKPFIAFITALFKYDVFFISFNGFFISAKPLRYLQAQLLKLAGKKIVALPYGSDSYVYRNIRSTSTIHGLMMSYPDAAKSQAQISQDVEYWVKHSHAVIPAFMGPDGFGRWDVLIPNTLMLDLQLWIASKKNNSANGYEGEVVIVHAPNHRGFKGTEFIIEAVTKIKESGLKVRLILLENIQNEEVRRIFKEEADILIDQIIFTGHGLNAVEGMASGLTTICNLDDDNIVLPFRRWSYFDECPLVSATPENLVNVLQELITQPALRTKLGKAGRKYVEKYHGEDSANYLFTNIIEYVYGRKTDLINLYHPLLAYYPRRKPKIEHPLVQNRIVDE